MKGPLGLGAIVVIAFKRLIARRWLTVATTLGLVVSVALTMSIPLYADAVYYRVLKEALGPEEASGPTPITFKFQYIGSWAEPVDLEDVQPLDAYLAGEAIPDLGLPHQFTVRQFRSVNLDLFAAQGNVYTDILEPLTTVRFAVVEGLERHVEIEGQFPAVAVPSIDSAVEVLVSDSFASELGLQVGETYTAFTPQTGAGTRTVQLPVRIAGVWKAADSQEPDPFWHYFSSDMHQDLIVPEGTLAGRIAPYVDQEIGEATWQLVMDSSNIHAADVTRLVERIDGVKQRALALLPETHITSSATDALFDYQQAVQFLSLLLYAFNIPTVGLLLAFVGLVVGLAVSQQRNEIAVLRSRGATGLQIVGIATLEGLLLGIVALAIGLPVGIAITHVVGRARSFLDFTLSADLRVAVTAATIRTGLIATGLSLLAQVIPTITAARHTIVSYKQETARTLRRPWWQRAFLDIMLLIPAGYGAYVLRQQGSIAASDAGNALSADPFQNPLLLLVPALSIFALTLLFLRLLPLIMNGVAWIAARSESVGFLLASRHLSRTSGLYTAPLVLLILTLSLSAFTASLAETLDQHLHDQMYYRFGADLNLAETGERLADDGQNPDPTGVGAVAAVSEEGPRWRFLPLSEHLQAPGVLAAARVGTYDASAILPRNRQAVTLIGIDPWNFRDIAFWRGDFAPISLGEMMNALTLWPDGVLVSHKLMQDHSLYVGDRLRVTAEVDGQSSEMDLTIVGAFDLFPTWYPRGSGGARPLLVGNLDHVFEQLEGQYPYDVWLRTDPGLEHAQIVKGVRDRGFNVVSWKAPSRRIAAAQQRPERQGLLGMLSVGFMAAACLTVLGFLLYAFFSFRRRFIEMGILRAVGLSARQMTVFLAWELAFLVLLGLIVGTGQGVFVSQLFIPHLQVGAEAADRIPPYVVQIAWPAILRIYVLFGLLFAGALGGLTVLLLRIKIFQAIKLGETG